MPIPLIPLLAFVAASTAIYGGTQELVKAKDNALKPVEDKQKEIDAATAAAAGGSSGTTEGQYTDALAQAIAAGGAAGGTGTAAENPYGFMEPDVKRFGMYLRADAQGQVTAGTVTNPIYSGKEAVDKAFKEVFTSSNPMAAFDQLKDKLYMGGFYKYGYRPAYGGTSVYPSTEDYYAVMNLLTYSNATNLPKEDALQERLAVSASMGNIPAYANPQESASYSERIAKGERDQAMQFIADPNDPTNLLKNWANENGLAITQEALVTNAQRISEGTTTLDQVQKAYREKYLAGMYPAWKDELMAGQNVRDIAAPYINRYAKLMEVDENSIKLDNPIIQRALNSVDANGKITAVPMHEFDKIIKNEGAWYETANAREETVKGVENVLRMMGL
jgi:hypothetical protein